MSGMPWFRFYAESLNDPKVQKLDGEDFKAWVNLLCIASQNDGRLPPLEDVAYLLRDTQNATQTLLERLHNGGLIDRCNGGANGWHYAPHNWKNRQFKSDNSTARSQKHRSRRNVAATPPDTDADTYTDTEFNAASYWGNGRTDEEPFA